MRAFAENAQEYHGAGTNVLPIVAGTKVPPEGVAWKRWQCQRQTPAEISDLMAAYPNADIAVILGEGSGGLVDILDLFSLSSRGTAPPSTPPLIPEERGGSF